MSLPDKAEPLLKLFITKTKETFGDRIIALFKLGSLGDRGDFSLCSDVDVALMLNKIENTDEGKIKILWDEIKASGLEYADRLSVYWSCYGEDFNDGRGRFPALDRLDFIQHAILMDGEDRRAELKQPTHNDLIIESANFILNFMLAGEKADELTKHPKIIMQKGARYFTKFVLFPVRLIFTLDNPNIVGSNRDAVNYFNQHVAKQLPISSRELVNTAYLLRNNEPDSPVELDEKLVHKGLIYLYKYCMQQYAAAVLNLGEKDLADRLQKSIKSLY